MKSSLATRKFDRLFSSSSSSKEGQQQQKPNPKSTDEGDDEVHHRRKVVKEVRWKLDDLELEEGGAGRHSLTARARQLENGRRRLEVALQALQTSLREGPHQLCLEDEALKELQEHYLDLLQNGKLWRENSLKKMESPEEGGGGGESFQKTKGEQFEETLASVLASLERFGRPPELSYSSSSRIGGGGDEDEEEKIAAAAAVKSTLAVLGVGTKAAGTVGRNFGWQFWFWRSDQRFLKWDNGLQKLGTPFQTGGQMRALLEQLLEIEEVALPSDYSVFREGVKPKWEDEANREGGEWSLEFARAEVALVAAIWRRMLETLIFEEGAGTFPTLNSTARAHISGLKLSMRFKAYHLSVWTGSYVDLEKTLQVGVAFQRIIADQVSQSRLSGSCDQQQQQPQFLHYRLHKSVLVREEKKKRSRFGADRGAGGGGGAITSNHKMFG